jgi:Fic family protein
LEPLLYLSAYFEQHRSEYNDHLLLTSQSGDPLPWLTFFLHGVRRQARDAEERTVRLVELHHELRNQLLEEGWADRTRWSDWPSTCSPRPSSRRRAPSRCSA